MKKIYRTENAIVLKGLIILFVIAMAVINIKLTRRNKPVASKLDLRSLQMKYKQYD